MRRASQRSEWPWGVPGTPRAEIGERSGRETPRLPARSNEVEVLRAPLQHSVNPHHLKLLQRQGLGAWAAKVKEQGKDGQPPQEDQRFLTLADGH
jgi:hypothetical protein